MNNSTIFTTEKTVEEITPEVIAKFIKRHSTTELCRLEKLRDYYSGKHSIMNRVKADELSNHKVVANYANYIAFFAASYLLGEPVSYAGKNDADIAPLTDMLAKADSATQDIDLALDTAAYGRGYEMPYFSSENNTKLKLAKLSPLNSFVVYDSTVEQLPVVGTYYFPVYDDNGSHIGYKGQYATAKFMVDIKLDTNFSVTSSGNPMEHYFGEVPIIEYYNNGDRSSDFEQVISLIDVYNLLQSDRINDKEQFVDALLLIKGQILGDTETETAEAYNAIRDNKVMMMDSDGDAAFLTRQFDEASIELLRKAISDDIHKFSFVPDMTDQNFASNSSGVAMRYKLLGLEQLAKIKGRYFEEGLRYRLRLFQNISKIKGGAGIDVDDVEITFNRSLPANDSEEAQVAATLTDIVPQKILYSRLSMIKDPESAIEEMKQQKAEETEAQKAIFGNTPIINNADEQ